MALYVHWYYGNQQASLPERQQQSKNQIRTQLLFSHCPSITFSSNYTDSI